MVSIVIGIIIGKLHTYQLTVIPRTSVYPTLLASPGPGPGPGPGRTCAVCLPPLPLNVSLICALP